MAEYSPRHKNTDGGIYPPNTKTWNGGIYPQAQNTEWQNIPQTLKLGMAEYTPEH